jgi:hypothetical protein
LFDYRGAPNVLLAATLIRLSQAQVPAILNHARALPQRDGRAGPALAGGAEGGERNGVVLDLRSDWGFEFMRVR